MKCNFCGSHLIGNEKYCPNCGSRVVLESTLPLEDTKSTEKARGNSIVLGVVSLAGVIIGIFAPISLILSIIGLIMAIKSNRNIKNTVGIALNSISLFFSLIITTFIFLIIYFTFFAIDRGTDIINNYNERIYERF